MFCHVSLFRETTSFALTGVRIFVDMSCDYRIWFSRHAGNILNDDVYYGRSILEDRPLQALAAGLKAYATWEAVSTLQACRECTGGMVRIVETNRGQTRVRNHVAIDNN